MTVYRITLTQYTDKLVASGRSARWNGKGTFLIYTAGSIALACLENLAHRVGTDTSKADFSVMEIEVPDTIRVKSITKDYLQKLHQNWHHVKQYPLTQHIGDKWIDEAKELILKVPSAIINNEYNYLFNPRHPDFGKLAIKNVSPFSFDQRIL